MNSHLNWIRLKNQREGENENPHHSITQKQNDDDGSEGPIIAKNAIGAMDVYLGSRGADGAGCFVRIIGHEVCSSG